MSDDGGRKAAQCLDRVQSEISIQDGAMAANIKITFLSEGSQYANGLKINHFKFLFGESKAEKVRKHKC